MSELKDIYKFIFDYFKIYKESLGQNVSNWKIADLNNAIKWSNGIEEFYAKIKYKKFASKFILDIKLILQHWNIDSNCEDLLQNATKFLKKSLISNKNLNNEVKSCLLESFVTQHSENQNKETEEKEQNGQEDLLNHEIDKICLKLYLNKADPYLVDVLFDYTINQQNNLLFVAKIFEKLKDFSYDTYKICFLRLLNKKYFKLYKNDPKNGLFDLETKELVQAYFCYLVFLFTELIEEFKIQNKEISDPKNHELEFISIEKLISHFENAIMISKNPKFIKIIQTKARIDSGWNYMLNELKLRYLKRTQQLGNILDDLALDD